MHQELGFCLSLILITIILFKVCPFSFYIETEITFLYIKNEEIRKLGKENLFEQIFKDVNYTLCEMG